MAGRPRLTATFATAVLAGEAALALLRPRAGVVVPLPVPATGYFSPAEIGRARRYRRAQLTTGLAGGAVRLGLIVAARRRVCTGVDQVDTDAHTSAVRAVGGAAIAGAVMTVGDTLVALPFSAAARRRALEAGLATDAWPAWVGDKAKATAISAVLTAAAAAAATALIRRRPHDWWLPASGLTVATSVAGATLAPVLLDPVFNDFEPLTGEPRDSILKLATQAGVKVGSTLKIDASRRTSAANAYVGGLGRTKRVVLFDTLLDRYPPAERDLVIAHELAHVRHRDVRRLLGFLALTAPPTAAFVQALAAQLDPHGIGAGRPSARSLPALALAAGASGALTLPASLRLSRRVENRADAYALSLKPDPDAFVAFERRIALQNLADPDPPRLLQLVLGTHPTTIERIGIAEALRGPRPAAPPAARSPAGS